VAALALPRALDTQLAVEAPEGILLQLRPAGVVSRTFAFLIDLFIRFGIFIALSIPLAAMGGIGSALLLISLFLLEWFYPVVFELRMRGATPGKRALGLKVVMDSGLPVTPAASITRNLLRFADFLPFGYGFGLTSMLLRGDFKRLGDLAAGTLVVYEPTRVRTPKLPAAAPRPPARALTTAEQAALIALAQRAPRLTEERVEELAGMADAALGTAHLAPEAPRAPRLFAVAQWLYGHR
jgi:uncharacterized RDD family membrane protein YckC